MDYKLLKDILPLLTAFQLEHGANASVKEFMHWCASQIKHEEEGFRSNYEAQMKKEEGAHNVETVLAMLLVFLYRYGKGYIKKALPSDLSAEEFAYLAGLMQQPGITKMELIGLNIHEKTTGIEIINRLLQKGYASQAENPGDRRSRCLHITDSGRAVLGQSYAPMYKAAKIIGGNLTPAEKRQLLTLLEKLHVFHKPIFEQDKDSELDAVLSTYFEENQPRY